MKRGFTLVEIIVSLAIFSIVAVVALGALVKIVSANKKAQTLQSAITNLNYAMESISREMRVGSSYYCGETPPSADPDSYKKMSCNTGMLGNDIDNTDAYIAFKSPKLSIKNGGSETCKLIVVYKFSSVMGVDNGIGKWKQSTCDDTEIEYSPVLDQNVILDGFFVRVSDENGSVPLATMRLSGHTGVKEREKTYFDLQTSISPRVEER